jgi:GNAT superfamily N-acetyltransferase
MNDDGLKGYSIHLVKEWPAREIQALYQAGGWWDADDDPEMIPRTLHGSFAVAIAVDEATGKAVGMGRAISDGASDAYIQDVVVFREYRRFGLGRQLVLTLISACRAKGIRWIALVAEPGSLEFYQSLGLKPIAGFVPMRVPDTVEP